MDYNAEIVNAVIENLKNDEYFKDWTEERFEKLREFFIRPFPEEDTEEYIEMLEEFAKLVTGG